MHYQDDDYQWSQEITDDADPYNSQITPIRPYATSRHRTIRHNHTTPPIEIGSNYHFSPQQYDRHWSAGSGISPHLFANDQNALLSQLLESQKKLIAKVDNVSSRIDAVENAVQSLKDQGCSSTPSHDVVEKKRISSTLSVSLSTC